MVPEPARGDTLTSWSFALSHATEAESRAERTYRAVSTFWTSLKRVGAGVIDLLKTAPRWFLMVVIAGSTAFGAGAGTACGMIVVDSLARIERYATDQWQSALAQHAERIGRVEATSRFNTEELERRARMDAEFRGEMRREFDRLNLRLSRGGR